MLSQHQTSWKEGNHTKPQYDTQDPGQDLTSEPHKYEMALVTQL
jgi:hypothetical protein